MKKDQCIKWEGPEPLATVLARLMAKVRPHAEPPVRTDEVTAPICRSEAVTLPPGDSACFDFDLAEFPLFSFGKRPPRDPFAPVTYTDTIRGKDGRPVTPARGTRPRAGWG